MCVPQHSALVHAAGAGPARCHPCCFLTCFLPKLALLLSCLCEEGQDSVGVSDKPTLLVMAILV